MATIYISVQTHWFFKEKEPHVLISP